MAAAAAAASAALGSSSKGNVERVERASRRDCDRAMLLGAVLCLCEEVVELGCSGRACPPCNWANSSIERRTLLQADVIFMMQSFMMMMIYDLMSA